MKMKINVRENRRGNQEWKIQRHWQHWAHKTLDEIRVITKLPNTEQSSKGRGKTHKSTNRQNQSTTGKLGKPQWP